MADDRQQNLLRQAARLAGELGPALAPASHLELLEAITDAARELFGAAACSLALLTEDRSELVFHVASGQGAREVVGVRMPSSQGIAGWVASSGQPIAIEDLEQDQRFARDVAATTGYVPRSILAMPLQTGRGILGVISVLDRTNERGSDMDTLALFARQAALAIESGRVFSAMGGVLFDALGRASGDERLSELLTQAALDSEGESRRLGEIAALFAELMHLSDGDVRLATDIVQRVLEHGRSRW